MLKVFYFLAVFVLVLGIVPCFLQAQVRVRPYQTCLEKAAKEIRPNKPITVFRTDGSKFEGRFVSVDLGQSFLTVSPLGDDDTLSSTFRISDITKIHYKKGRRLRLGWMLGGLVAGAMVGYYAGGYEFYGGTNEEGAQEGLQTGAIVGLIAGTVLPYVLFSRNATIECK